VATLCSSCFADLLCGCNSIFFSLLRLTFCQNVNIELFYPECAVRMTFWDKFYGKMLFPIIIFAIFTVSFGFQELVFKTELYKRRAKPDVVERIPVPLSTRLISLFQFIVVTLYTFIISTVFQPFNCLKQPDNTYTMAKSPSSYCYDTAWKKNLPALIFFILIYCVGFPAALVYIFFKNGKNLDTVDFRVKYGNLISPYARRFFYWELIIMLKRSSFIVTNDFLSTGADYAARFVVGIVLLCVFFWVDVNCSPYRMKEMNFVQNS
jgi:hypothetical protein